MVMQDAASGGAPRNTNNDSLHRMLLSLSRVSATLRVVSRYATYSRAIRMPVVATREERATRKHNLHACNIAHTRTASAYSRVFSLDYV